MPKRILLVDDDHALLTAWMTRLKASGYDVVTAASGEAGLVSARAARPDLIILDIRMPGLDGLDVCRQLKADPALAPIPVLFMSANVKDDARRSAHDLGAMGFLPKPLQSKIVLAAIESAIDGRAVTI